MRKGEEMQQQMVEKEAEEEKGKGRGGGGGGEGRRRRGKEDGARMVGAGAEANLTAKPDQLKIKAENRLRNPSNSTDPNAPLVRPLSITVHLQ
jgi:hypothetical protein